jgi:hypothetical protein
MATREEILIGFQLISKINAGNLSLDNAACTLQWLDARTRDRINGAYALARVQESVACDCEVVAVEVETALQQFIENFVDQEMLVNGLRHFRTDPSDFSEDNNAIQQHTPNVRNVLALVSDEPTLRENGELLSLHQERVDLYVDPLVHFSPEHVRMNILQDLLNAIAFELRGICSATGEEKYPSIEARQSIIKFRMRTAIKAAEACPNNSETRRMVKVLNDIKRNLYDAVVVSDLTLLGDFVDRKIPQLPLIRRWWSYA